jgi:DNA-binding FadR family transcriptional regulator
MINTNTSKSGNSQQKAKGRAAESVAEALIDEIRSNKLTVGDPLPTERTLSERFGTSRPTIRAALMMMQSRGFATLETTKRPKVSKPSIGGIFESVSESIRELMGDAESGAYLEQVRHFVEVGAVRVASLEASNIQISYMHAALEGCKMAIGKDPDFRQADASFHRAVVSVVQNPIILELHDRFVGTMLSTRRAGPDPAAQDQEIYEEHKQIFEAILRKEPEKAIEIMDNHLSRSYRARMMHSN